MTEKREIKMIISFPRECIYRVIDDCGGAGYPMGECSLNKYSSCLSDYDFPTTCKLKRIEEE